MGATGRARPYVFTGSQQSNVLFLWDGRARLLPSPAQVKGSPMANRKKPAHGVWIDPDRPTIVFLTVCTRDRLPWLATEENHRRLCEVWERAKAWLVGRYVLMPDHLHLFAAPGPLGLPLDTWVRY
jgi:hypothetical protein